MRRDEDRLQRQLDSFVKTIALRFGLPDQADEPIDFFRYIEHLRLRGCHDELEQLPSEQRWGSSVVATLNALESRVKASGPQTVALYGSASIGNAIRDAARSRPALRDGLTFVAFVSSPQFRTAAELHGLPWQTPEWLTALYQRVEAGLALWRGQMVLPKSRRS